MSRSILPTTTALEADIESLVLKYNLVHDKTVKSKRDFTAFLTDVEIFKAEVKDKLSATEESLESCRLELSAVLKAMSEEMQQEIAAEAHQNRLMQKRLVLLTNQAAEISATIQDCSSRVLHLEDHCGTTVLPF